MEVCFRSFSFLYGVICRFQPLIFQGVPSPTKQKIQVSRSSCAASKMCAVTCRARFIMAVASGFRVVGVFRFQKRRFGPRGPGSASFITCSTPSTNASSTWQSWSLHAASTRCFRPLSPCCACKIASSCG